MKDAPHPPTTDDGAGAAASFWREQADAHRAELRSLRGRPAVRLALRADRALAPLREPTRRALGTASSLRRRAGVSAKALASRRDRPRRRRALDAAVAGLAGVEPRCDVTVLAIDDGARSPGIGTVLDLDRRIAAASTELVCLRRSSIAALDPWWAERLATAMTDGVVAASAHIVHPDRKVHEATPHDLLTRERGLAVEDRLGVPTVVALGAGDEVGDGLGLREVPAASASAVLLRRDAVTSAGGLSGAIPEVDAAVVELCTRLRAAGGRVCCVGEALVTDERPVASAEALHTPVGTETLAWRRVVERHGGAVVSAATDEDDGLSIALTTAVPGRKLTERWGDWHLATGLARALESRGHRTVVQTGDESESLAGRACDVHVVLRGLRTVPPTPGQTQVLWIVSHPESVTAEECDAADLVCVASERFAAELRARTDTPVQVVLQATDHHRFRPVAPDPVHRHPVTIVAKSRERLRDAVATALEAGLRPAVYGSGWEPFIDPDLVVADHVPNEDLPAVYCSAGVVLNDHWETMKASGFVSNRVFDVLACGAPIVSDHLDELPRLFGDAVPTYHDAASLRSAVEDALDDPDRARARAERGRAIVLGAHTLDHRAAELLAHLEAHGLPAARHRTTP